MKQAQRKRQQRVWPVRPGAGRIDSPKPSPAATEVHRVRNNSTPKTGLLGVQYCSHLERPHRRTDHMENGKFLLMTRLLTCCLPYAICQNPPAAHEMASRACSSFGVTPEGARRDYIIISEQLSKFWAKFKLDAKFSFANSQANQRLTS
jgi:hypothetical protein